MSFPPGFFERGDPKSDGEFYAVARLVTHIDASAIKAVEDLYEELRVDGDVLDLMSSWVSHFRAAPRSLTVLGMNADELASNPQATAAVVHDLNRDPRLPLAEASFDTVVCCVSIDYLTSPIEVFRDVRRVLRAGGAFVCTFSNRLFPTKAVKGWLYADDEERCRIVTRYFDASGGWTGLHVRRCTPVDHLGDPLFAVWAESLGAPVGGFAPR